MIIPHENAARSAVKYLIERANTLGVEKLGVPYFVLDYETQSKPGYPSKDALVVGRADVLTFSICVVGHSFSFPTSLVNPKFPKFRRLVELVLRPLFEAGLMLVCHHLNYDGIVSIIEGGLKLPSKVWCTMIGAWSASEYREKGLKARAYRYGRVLSETKHVDFSNLRDLSYYAEQDSVATDDLLFAQWTGKVCRPKRVTPLEYPFASAGFNKGELKGHLIPSIHPTNYPVDEREVLRPYMRNWNNLVELPVLRSTIRAEIRGFPVIRNRLLAIREVLRVDMERCLKEVYKLAGSEINIGSGPQMAEAFKKLGIQNTSVSRKTKKMSFNAKALYKLKGQHPFVDAVLKLRQLEKLQSVYVGDKPEAVDQAEDSEAESVSEIESVDDGSDSGFEHYINPETGNIHCTLATIGAVTGRHSSSRPNMQQVPSRKDIYNLKDCFGYQRLGKKLNLKSDDYVLIVLDHSQLEIRVMCILAQDPKMTEILSDESGDIHNETSSSLCVPRDPDSKQLNFLMLYAGKAPMMSEQLTFSGSPTSVGQCEQYIIQWNAKYYRVPEYRKELLNDHQIKGYCTYLNLRRRHIPFIDWSDKWAVHRAETTLSNNIVQGSGQDLLKAAIVRLDPQCINPDRAALETFSSKFLGTRHSSILRKQALVLDKHRKLLRAADCRYLLQVHDELVFKVKLKYAEECLNVCATVMSWEHYMPSIFTKQNKGYCIPLVAEGGVGFTWKEAKSKDKHLHHVKIGYDYWRTNQ